MSSSNERNSENTSDDGQHDNNNTLSLSPLAQSAHHANISNQQQQVGPQTQSLQLNQYQALLLE